MASSTFKVGQKVRVKRIPHRPDLDTYLPTYGVVTADQTVTLLGVTYDLRAVTPDMRAGGEHHRTFAWYLNLSDVEHLDGLLDI